MLNKTAVQLKGLRDYEILQIYSVAILVMFILTSFSVCAVCNKLLFT